MADKKERNDLTTPKGTVSGFTALQKPDTKFDEDGVFQTTLSFEPDAISDLVEQIEAVRDEKFEEVKEQNPKVKKQLKKVDVTKPETDAEGEETGNVLLKFKQKAKITSKKTGETFKKKIGIYDAKGKKVTKTLRVGPGSVLKVNFEPVGYYSAKDKEVGATLRLRGVQIIKYVEYSGGGPSAEDMGFDAEDEEDAFDSDEFDGDEDSEDEDQTSGDGESEEDEEDF